nr:MAG TPA: hypothetical protein [Crassvirales sp.]
MEQEKRIFDGAWVDIAQRRDNGRVLYDKVIRVDLSDMIDYYQFNRYVKQNLGEGGYKIISSYGVPKELLNNGSIDSEFFGANKKLKAHLREPYEMWLKRQADEFGWDARASADAFEYEYFGRFESMEEYAIKEIEFLDSHYQLPMKLSGKMIPELLLEDKDFMDLLWVMEGRTPFGWEKVIYVFHAQEYLDIIDPLN